MTEHSFARQYMRICHTVSLSYSTFTFFPLLLYHRLVVTAGRHKYSREIYVLDRFIVYVHPIVDFRRKRVGSQQEWLC